MCISTGKSPPTDGIDQVLWESNYNYSSVPWHTLCPLPGIDLPSSSFFLCSTSLVPDLLSTARHDIIHIPSKSYEFWTSLKIS